ncbi:MAG: SDR family NAD(P)-dependent oxidoreductase [Saprospiraceae bacterium]|nr:SDR family NAD(P)-dependent oxidoreductase [Lewinella sp.]
MKILVTGASRGIGYDTTLQLARTREHQLLALGRSEAKLTALAAKVREELGDGILDVLVYDLTNADPARLESALRKLGGLDVLINNAGLLINKPFDQLTPSDWHDSFHVNLFAVVNTIRIVLPYLSAASAAHIVNIGSMGGFQGSSKFVGLSAYSAAKAALANLTECLAEEFKDWNIAVNCLSLGAVQTEMLTAAFPGYQAPVSSKEMGAWVAWFAVNGQRYFNGKILPVSISTP